MSISCVVVGGGVIGLACARALGGAGMSALVLERHASVGVEVSGRNSEVIHAGMYYPKGSMKSKLCLRGKDQLYEYLQRNHIDHKKCGKLIVATAPEDLPKLSSILAIARTNGITDLRLMSKEEAKIMEPNVNCVGAIFSPSTGILDTHSYMEGLLGDAENFGAELVRKCDFISAEVLPQGSPARFRVTTSQGDIDCDNLVNSAGMSAIQVASQVNGYSQKFLPRQYYAKGSYFKLACAQTKTPFNHLIYPIPVAGGLGTHATLDLAGGVRFGPDVQWLENPNRPASLASDASAADDKYFFAQPVNLSDGPAASQWLNVDPTRATQFYKAIQQYWDIPADSLVPDYSGIRPKLLGPHKNVYSGLSEAALVDFMIQSSALHSVPGLVNLFGMESPGLTSSLAVADHVTQLLQADKT